MAKSKQVSTPKQPVVRRDIARDKMVKAVQEASRLAVQETFDKGLNISIFEDGLLKVIDKHGKVVAQKRVIVDKQKGTITYEEVNTTTFRTRITIEQGPKTTTKTSHTKQVQTKTTEKSTKTTRNKK